MKKFLYSFLFLIIINCAKVFAIDAKDFDKYFKLLPQPQKIEFSTESPLYYKDLKFLHLEGLKHKPVLTGVLASLPASSVKGKGTLTLLLTKAAAPSSPEGYLLEIKDGQVFISANNVAGLFYGGQTLLQLMEDSRDQNIGIPACKITDYPDVAYRAIHLDLKHHVDSVSYYYNLIDRLAQIKINAVIVEFEDKLGYREASKVAAGNAISIEEFAKISHYAKARNIEISPLVQGLGHASFILKHDEYKELRDDTASDWSFDALNPKTYDLQFSLYKDAIAATPNAKYLHVGGDEVGNLGLSDLAKKSGMKPVELQMYWLKKVCDFAQANNRIPIFWDDMVFKLSNLYKTTYDPEIDAEQVKNTWNENEHLLNENIQLFPKNCIYMRWNYDTPGLLGNRKAIGWYKSHNLDVMPATAGQTMWPMLPREHSNFKSIKEFTGITSEEKLKGILCTFWDDCSPHFETYWRGIYDFAFFSWHYKDVTADDAHAIFRHRFYAPELSDPSFNFQDSLEKSFAFWETALLNKGDRNNYPKDIDIISLPEAKRSGVWSKKYSKKIIQARHEISRYTLIRKKIEDALQLAQRNQYSLQLFDQLNELQIYPSKLLLLLEKYDKVTSLSKKKIIRKQLQEYVSGFQQKRKEFEEVFTQTRVLNNPTDYLPDQNHHAHLANGTNNSDWMYVYELAMNDSIKKWLNH